MEKNSEISEKDQGNTIEEKPIKHPLLDGKYFQIVKRKKKAITCVCMQCNASLHASSNVSSNSFSTFSDDFKQEKKICLVKRIIGKILYIIHFEFEYKETAPQSL